MVNINIVRKSLERINRLTESRAIYYIIAGLLVLAAALQAVLITGTRQGITGLEVDQVKDQIRISWKDRAGADAYLVRVRDKNTGKTRTFKTADMSCSVPCDVIPGNYVVSVRSVDPSGNDSYFPTAESETIKLRKYTQKIKIDSKEILLVEGEKKKIRAKASGDINYDTDSEVINVTDKGTVKAVSPGKTELKVCAEGGSYFYPEEKTVSVTVFPDELDTPKVMIKEKDDFDAVLTWDEVPYAESYEIYKGTSAEPFMETEKREATVARSSSGYRIKAKVKVDDEYVTSPYSDVAKIDSYVDKAASYSSPYLLKRFDSSDLEEVMSIPCAGSNGAPQSFSFTGSDYIITYEDRTLVTFGEDGEEKSRTGLDMSRPNGSTYADGKVYIVHTTSGCTVFDTENGDASSVRIPRITSGIAYDDSAGSFYLSGGPKILITDEEFNETGRIMKVRYNRAQDIGAGDGVILVAIWTGSTNYVDVYRSGDLSYIGGYEIPFGEIESVTSVDKHLVFLMHNTLFNGTRSGKILRTRDKLPIS